MKTGLITELLNNWGKVNLFTRPRRFGKSLNMNMLKYFFSYGCDPDLFVGLSIFRETQLCEKYMGKFPVISITLKGVEARDYQGAAARLIKAGEDGQQMFAISEDALENSLYTLSFLLHKHFNQKVIPLIDEYDVPLDKAQQYGYYDEMVSLIRSIFGHALKTNENLYFAVLTGCLFPAKESIFTERNNFNVSSTTNLLFDKCFGFSDTEVRDMLEYCGLEDKYELIKEWYNVYHFSKADIYCPWDVLNYIDLLRSDPDAYPEAF